MKPFLDTGLKLNNKSSKNKFIKNSKFIFCRIKEKKEYKGI
jgi:hypothetical protein